MQQAAAIKHLLNDYDVYEVIKRLPPENYPLLMPNVEKDITHIEFKQIIEEEVQEAINLRRRLPEMPRLCQRIQVFASNSDLLITLTHFIKGKAGAMFALPEFNGNPYSQAAWLFRTWPTPAEHFYQMQSYRYFSSTKCLERDDYSKGKIINKANNELMLKGIKKLLQEDGRGHAFEAIEESYDDWLYFIINSSDYQRFEEGWENNQRVDNKIIPNLAILLRYHERTQQVQVYAKQKPVRTGGHRLFAKYMFGVEDLADDPRQQSYFDITKMYHTLMVETKLPEVGDALIVDMVPAKIYLQEMRVPWATVMIDCNIHTERNFDSGHKRALFEKCADFLSVSPKSRNRVHFRDMVARRIELIAALVDEVGEISHRAFYVDDKGGSNLHHNTQDDAIRAYLGKIGFLRSEKPEKPTMKALQDFFAPLAQAHHNNQGGSWLFCSDVWAQSPANLPPALAVAGFYVDQPTDKAVCPSCQTVGVVKDNRLTCNACGTVTDNPLRLQYVSSVAMVAKAVAKLLSMEVTSDFSAQGLVYYLGQDDHQRHILVVVNTSSDWPQIYEQLRAYNGEKLVYCLLPLEEPSTEPSVQLLWLAQALSFKERGDDKGLKLNAPRIKTLKQAQRKGGQRRAGKYKVVMQQAVSRYHELKQAQSSDTKETVLYKIAEELAAAGDWPSAKKGKKSQQQLKDTIYNYFLNKRGEFRI